MNNPSTPQLPMFPPRTVIFVSRDGFAFVSPTFPGAPNDYANIGLGQCEKNWNDIYQEFASCQSREAFYDTAKRVQHYYDLPGWERKELPVTAVPAGSSLTIGNTALFFVAEREVYHQLTIEETSAPPAPPIDGPEAEEEPRVHKDPPVPTAPEQIKAPLEKAPTTNAAAPASVPEPKKPVEKKTPAVKTTGPAVQEKTTIGKVIPGVNDLASYNPEIAAEWNYEKNAPYTPSDISAKSQKKMWWRCKVCSHEWEAYVHNRALRNTSCPHCRTAKQEEQKSQAAKPVETKPEPVKVPKPETKKPVNLRSLAIKHPDIAKEWHPTKNGNVTPEDVNASSSQFFWFRCKSGHDWLARVDVRARGAQCPYCSGRIALDEDGNASPSNISAVQASVTGPAENKPTPKFSVGDAVSHRDFGRGVIQKVVPYPNTGDALIEIRFDKAGIKRLMLRGAVRFMEKLNA